MKKYIYEHNNHNIYDSLTRLLNNKRITEKEYEYLCDQVAQEVDAAEKRVLDNTNIEELYDHQMEAKREKWLHERR